MLTTPSSAEDRIQWSCTSTPPYVYVKWQLNDKLENFTMFNFKY
jgi:hypothetical protein